VINFVNIKEQDKHSRILGSEAAEQGMWGFEAGYNSDGEIEISPVNSVSEAGKDSDKLGIIMNYPVDKDGAESDHYAIAAGERVVFVKAAGVEVEDDILYTKSTTTIWGNLSFGDALCVNASGYLTSVAAADAPTGAITVAEFMNLENSIIFYRTVDSTDAVS